MPPITITRFTGSAPTCDPTLQPRTPTPLTVIGAAMPPPDPTRASSLRGRATCQPEIRTSLEAEAIKGILAQRLNFSSLTLDLRDNKNVALAAVSQDGYALQYASANLQNDKEVVLAAVSQSAWALEYASENLRNDKEVVLAAVSQHGELLGFASGNLQNDKEVVLTAVSQYGHALTYASDDLQNDKEVVLTAVSQFGKAVRFASANLKNDREVVLAAVSQNGEALQIIGEDLKNDVEVAAAAVAQKPTAKQYVPESILRRALAEIATNPAFLPFVDQSLITYEIAQKAVKLNHRLLRFVPPEILANTPTNIEQHDDIISCALDKNPEALDLIPWDLLTAEMLSFVIRRHKTNNKAELIRSLVTFAIKMGTKTSAEIRSPHLDLAWPLLEFFENSKKVMIILIVKYGLDITDVGSEIKNDPDIIAAHTQTLEKSLRIPSQSRYIQTSLDGPVLSGMSVLRALFVRHVGS